MFPNVGFKFIDEKDALDVPELELGKLYAGANNDGQLIDIYDRITGHYIGTYAVERFARIEYFN